jgi:ribosomal protein S18 acetylase RimI-like enzyme
MTTLPASTLLRTHVHAADSKAVRRIVASTGFFSPPEIEIAGELVDERVAKGPASGYEFVFADRDGETIGYACYGEIPCTIGSYDLYWVAVRPAAQGHGLGRKLVAEVERLVCETGGRAIYLDTSSRHQYTPTRKFYEACGYTVAATFPDFYAPGDAKVVYWKNMETSPKSESQRPGDD